MKLSLFLFGTLLPFLTFSEEEKLWPPRGNNRPLIAATQALWWNKDDPEARKLKARALDFAGVFLLQRSHISPNTLITSTYIWFTKTLITYT